jgi:putative oxidoreductase
MTDRHRYEDATLSALRIAAGLGYFSHGAQKLFGWFGGFGPDGGTAALMTRFGAAGVIEVVCGTAIVLGLFTRPLAFAYFWVHAAGSDELFWWANGGERPMVYAFLWLYIAARGPGSFSTDAWLERRRAGTAGGAAGEAAL